MGEAHVVCNGLGEYRGVSAEQVLKDARANVCALTCDVHSHSGGHAYFVFADDSFQAARLVHVALFKDRPARGMWVAVVPDRNTFFLAESEDLEGLAGLARLAEKNCLDIMAPQCEAGRNS
jgi:hypothetical protein